MTLYGDGLGAWVHALFKIFFYYPFDREYDLALVGLQTEHDCWEDWYDRSDREICVPECRDDCEHGQGEVCAKPMIITEDNQWAEEDGDNDYRCQYWSDCNVYRKSRGADSDSETVEGEWKYWECQYTDAPYAREYSNLWGESGDTGGTMPSLGSALSWWD